MKNKKPLLLLAFIFVFCLSFTMTLVGCGDKYANMKVEIKGDTEITLYTEPENENQSKSTTISVVVSGVSGDVSKGIMTTIDNIDCISVEIGQPNDEGVTDIVVTAKQGGTTKVKVVTVEGNKTAVLTINVVQKLKSISVYANFNMTVFTNSTNVLDPINIISFTPSTTSQKDIKFEIVDASSDVEIITADGISALVVGDVATQVITIKATSVQDDKAIENVEPVEFKVYIIEALSIETVTVSNLTMSEDLTFKDGAYETTELTSNSRIDSKYRTNTIQITINPKNPTNEEYTIDDKDYYTHDSSIAEISKNSDSSTFIYNVTGVSFGDTTLEFDITIKGFEGYNYTVQLPVHVIELPSVVNVNGNTTDFSGTLFTVYDTYGLELNVTVGSSNAYDFRYEIKCDSNLVTLYDSTGGIISLMDEDGSELQKSNPRLAKEVDKIYAVAKSNDGNNLNTSSTISFVAYATTIKSDVIVETNFNFIISKGVEKIELESFDNNTIYVEKNGKATLNYTLTPQSNNEEVADYDDSYISYKIMTAGQENSISVEKSTEEVGQFVITGLKNAERISLVVTSANGIYSEPVNVTVYTPGTFVAVSLPSASTNNNILQTNYSNISYGDDGVNTIASLSQPYSNISYENNTPVATLTEGENANAPVYAATLATNTTHKFELTNDPSNEDQTIISISYKFVIPQISGNSVSFRDFDSKSDKIKATITSGGYLQTTGDGAMYILLSVKFLTGDEANGTVKESFYHRLIAISSYPKITTVSLRTLTDDVVYNKDGLGDIDVMNSDLKTYNYTRLTIGPESAISKEILRSENTKLVWSLKGVPQGVEIITNYKTTDLIEFNEDAEISIKDLKGIILVFDSEQGAYEFADSEEFMYTRAYLFFNFEDSYFGKSGSLQIKLSAQLTQFNTSFIKDISIVVKRPVKASSIDLNLSLKNVSNDEDRLLSQISKYSYELYIDSRDGLNDKEEVKDLTEKNRNLANSWQIVARLNPSSVTNGKLNYVVCDADGNVLEDAIIKVLDDGTVVPLASGVVFIKLVPMSGELSDTYLIRVRVANGESWESAYKIYNQNDLLAIAGDSATRYSTMQKYYELANDIYLSSTFRPIGVYSNEVVAFSGGLRGSNEYSNVVYSIYNFEMVSYQTNINNVNYEYAGLFGQISGEIQELKIDVKNCSAQSTSGEAYFGALAGKINVGAKVQGVIVDYNISGVYANQKLYFGGIAGINNGEITDYTKEYTYDSGLTTQILTRTKVTGNLNFELTSETIIGGFVGENGLNGVIKSDFDYFAESINFNNANDNVNVVIKANYTYTSEIGSIGGISGTNKNEIMNVSSHAIIDSNCENAGGIVGTNYAKLSDCYFVGSIKNAKNVGGIAGQIDVLQKSANSLKELTMTRCITEIMDTSLSTKTIVNESKIQGRQNVGGLVGYANFSTYTSFHNFTLGHNIISYSYVRSYLPLNAYSDIAVQGETGNVGGLVGYAKNLHIYNSYAIVNLNIEKTTTDLNVGGLVGKMENVVFDCVNSNSTVRMLENILISNSFTSGNILVNTADENGQGNIGQLVGLLDVNAENTMLGSSAIVSQVYTAVTSTVNYNSMLAYGLFGSVENIKNANIEVVFDKVFYLYQITGDSPYAYGTNKTLSELQDASITFSEWDNYGTDWKVLVGNNNDLLIIYIENNGQRVPFYTITATSIDLNIKEYTPEDEDQLFTRVDSSSSSVENVDKDAISKSVILYIYSNSKYNNVYSINNIVKISTVPVKVNNARYIVVSDNEDVIKIEGDTFICVGEGTAVITICSSYSKETVYDCIQIAVVHHNFDIKFLNNDLIEYTEEDTILIAKEGSEQVVVYIDPTSTISGLKINGELGVDDENAIIVNGKILGSDILLSKNTNSVYNNTLSIEETGVYEETTKILLQSIPYFNVKLYTNPLVPTDETLQTRTIYNSLDSKVLNILIYVGASEITFNTNNVSSSIGSEISVTVTLHTDYEEDDLLMFFNNELIMSDDTQNTVHTTDEFTISYLASSKNIEKYYDSYLEQDVFAGRITYEIKVNASDKYTNTLSKDMEILYTQIASSITFAGRSSYLESELSTNSEDYSVKNVFNFKIIPAIVSNINIQNFAAGRTVSGKYVPEDASTSIIPGEVGLLDILITPMYAGIKTIKIENASTNYTKISLLQVLQESDTGLYVQSNHLIVNTENGIELICKSNLLEDGSTTFDGHFYVRTLISSNIPLGIDLTLVVTTTYEEDGQMTTKVESITLTTAETSGIFMEFDGKNYAYLVKGTSITPTTKVIGFTNKVNYKLSTIEPTYENFKYYFDPTFVEMINFNTLTEEHIEILFNDQIIVNSDTGEIYVGVLIREGVTLSIEASVSEYQNNGEKIGTDNINVYVVDYKITGIKVQNAVNHTLTAICNIPKTLKVDFEIERCDYYDYEYEHLEEALPLSLYTNVVRAVEIFFGKSNNFVSSIDTEIAELLREINTYDLGIWQYSTNAVTDSVRTYKSITIGETYDKLFEVQSASYESISNLTCFAIRVKEITTLSFLASVNLTFSFDSTTNTVAYRFNPLKDPMIVGDDIILNYEFNVISKDSSSQDNPLPIYDQDKFLEYVFNTEDAHYILLTDIVLDDWSAKDTNIASLDGNGYTITINSFAEQKDEDGAYFGLFKTISSDTILTNVTVNIPKNLTLKTGDNVESTYVGLFAYENQGTLFNCSVVSSQDITIDVETKAGTVQNSLFVTNNTATGSISNSKVGYIDGLAETYYVIHLNSYNDMAGFVVNNSGHIASSFAKDISLTCKELSALNIDKTGVAGFVINNRSTGKIYFSYVEGIRGDDIDNTQIQLDSRGYKNYNTGIYSPGVIAGFVFNNAGYIQDAYANIPLISPTSSTGFVYSNTATGEILNAYSACLQPTTLDQGQEEYPNTSRSQFTGLNDLNEVQNNGTITYAYYYNADYDANIFTGLGEPALALPADSFQDSLDEFGNFVEGENMIWTVDPLHPQLVSANRVIRRQRYLVNNLTGDETDEELDAYIYYYEDVVDGEFDTYGSYTNPIVISSGVNLVQMSSEDRLIPYTNSSTGATTITTLNMNDYIVIKNIDISTVIDTGLESLQSITYAGMFEGNGYTFENVSILSEKSSVLHGQTFGMFSQIGAYLLFDNEVLITVDSTNYHAQMKNLTFEINEISGTHASAVGTLAGVVVNADILNINLVSNPDNEETVTVQGERYVGALAGYIAGDTTVTNITSNISVSADFRNNGDNLEFIKPFVMTNNTISNSIYAYKFNIDTVNYTGGYAGGLAGLVDNFEISITKNAENTYTSISRFDYDKTGYNYVPINFAPQISTVTIYDKVKIIGDVVGGVVGLNYSGSHIYNAKFVLELGEDQKISGELITGGLVGQNFGKIDQSYLTHDDTTQYSIDDLSTDKSDLSQELFYESNKSPIYVGGLVGYNVGTGSYSGIVTNCYSRANVINHNAEYVGGMIGYMNNGYLQYCYVSGNVVGSQEKEDPDTGKITGTNGISAGAVAHLVSFVAKNSIKYFTEYTGLSYYSMWSLVCANDWEEDVNIVTTAALIGKAGTGVKLEDGIINGDMDIFVNNMGQKLYDVLYAASVEEAYNIVNILEGVDGVISRYRVIASYTYETFKAYHEEGANPDENVLYQTWDRNIWDVYQPFFPKLLLNANGDQNYITNEEELRAIGTEGFYIIQNDIYLTKDWIPIEGFEGTLTSKKKKNGTYCTVYNININGECYNTIGEDNEEVENIGNVGFFSSIKDKAYIYNVNFVFGGNIMLPEDYEMEESEGAPVHVQRNQWENYEGKVGYTEDSGMVGEITYREAFVNGITNSLDYATIISNNSQDLQDGLFTNSYGTGGLAGVATNATFSNITISYGAYNYYGKDGRTATLEQASLNANTPYIGGFMGYASNCKLTNCQVADNPMPTFIKNHLNENIRIDGSAEINVYNNEYVDELTVETIKSIVNNYDDLQVISQVILEFYQQPQCVGGFIGKLDAKANYIKFNGRTVSAHINVREKYENGDKYNLPSPNLNIGGLVGYCNVATLDTVNVMGTIVTAVNTTGIDVENVGLDQKLNTTELNVGGVIGVTDKSMFNYCVYQGTIKLLTSSQSRTPVDCECQSIINVGGVMGKLKGDVTLNYCISKGYNGFTEVSGYQDFTQPIVMETTDQIDYVYIGGVLANASTLSPKIKKSMINGDIILTGNVKHAFVGGILGNLTSSELLTNKATIQTCYTAGNIYVRANISEQINIGGIVGKADKVSASSSASTMEIHELGTTLGKNCVVYAGNFGGTLGYSGVSDPDNVYVNDCFTAGMIRVNKPDLNGAIGGFIGAMFGKVKNSYTATTIISIADNNAVTVNLTESAARKATISNDGIIGPMFGYSDVDLRTGENLTAFYVFDYTGCVVREVEGTPNKYGKQVSVADITKECIYGTTDPIMSVFASSTSGSWKTLTYGEYLAPALYAYSLPILSFLESDTTLNSYCKFCETSLNERINILNESKSDVSLNKQAQEYELYYGAKLYPYLLKHKDGYTLNEFRTRVNNGIDVDNSYFAISGNFELDTDSQVAFDKMTFHLLGYGNSITTKNGKLFANTLNKERIISSVNFVSDYGIIGTNNGIIYNIIVSGDQTIENLNGLSSALVATNSGLLVNSGVIANTTIKKVSTTGKYGSLVGKNISTGIINSCFTTGIIFYEKEAASSKGSVSGFINTIEKGSTILNNVAASSMNVIDDDKQTYNLTMSAFATTINSSDFTIKRTFVDKLSIGYTDAYEFDLTGYNRSSDEYKALKAKIHFTGTSYLVSSSSEPEEPTTQAAKKSHPYVLKGVEKTNDNKDKLHNYFLAGSYHNYDYNMAYNYGYPYSSLVTYFEGKDIMNALFTGNGTDGDPYQIPHAGKLDWVRTMVSENSLKAFDITADIYMNVFSTFEPLFSSANKVYFINEDVDDKISSESFEYLTNITYKGMTTSSQLKINGLYNDVIHTIYYLTQDLTKMTNVGLIHTLGTKENEQKVINLAVVYANLTCPTVTKENEATVSTTAKTKTIGVLAGSIQDKAVIENVTVFNSIITVPEKPIDKTYIGGLVGTATSVSKIYRCSAEVKINMPATESNVSIGGLIGYTRNVGTIDTCYVGSNINLLNSEKSSSIAKVNLGGFVGFNSSDTTMNFNNSLTLTSFNYSGFVGYIFNNSDRSKSSREYYKEESIDTDLANGEFNEDKISSFANIGNLVGNSTASTGASKAVSNNSYTYYAKEITMVDGNYKAGNIYEKEAKLTNKTYQQIIDEFYKTDKNGELVFATKGARQGSKVNPYEIDGNNVLLKDFANENEVLKEFVLFGMFVNNQSVNGNDVHLLNGKFLYGAGFEIDVQGNLIVTAENALISNIKLAGTASGNYDIGDGRNATGLLVHFAKNTLINECVSQGTVDSESNYVGGLVGYGEGTVALKCTAISSTIEVGGNTEYAGGIGGELSRGGYWHCTVQDITINSTASAKVGGIAGHIPETNSFIVEGKIQKGTISASTDASDSGTAGGLVGLLDGLLVSGNIGSQGRYINISGYFAGGITGEVKRNADNIFLNNFTVYVKMNGKYVGGITSKLVGTKYTIKNSVINGEITGDLAVGGVVGYAKNAKIGEDLNGVLDDNKNQKYSNIVKATITSTTIDTTQGIGGIVGIAVNSNVLYNNLTNSLTVTMNGGGIVGRSVASTITYNLVNSSANINGQASDTSTVVTNIGGIVGLVDLLDIDIEPDELTKTSSITYNTISKGVNAPYKCSTNIGGIVGCANENVVISFNNSNSFVGGQKNVGGIIGLVDLSASENSSSSAITINNNNKTGNTITANFGYEENIEGGAVGGLVGYAKTKFNSQNNIIASDGNTLTIKGDNVGGIVGYAEVAITTTNDKILENASHEISGNLSAGGAIGYDNVGSTINYIDIKVATIKATDNAGGLVGYAKKTNIATYVTLKVTKTIYADKNSGGLFGTAINVSIPKISIKGIAENTNSEGKKATFGIQLTLVQGRNVGGYVGYAEKVTLGGGKENASGYNKNFFEVAKLQVSGFTINSMNDTEDVGAGALIGYAINSTSIEYVHAEVPISGSGANIGGLIGFMEGNSSLKQSSYNQALANTISATNVGGIVGKADGCTISDLFFNGASVTAKSTNSGGIIGYAIKVGISDVIVTTGNVSASQKAGGIAGILESVSTVSNEDGLKISVSNVTVSTDKKEYAAGGAIGYIISGSSVSKIIIETITSVTGFNAGGIVGYVDGASTVSNCSVKSSVSVTGSTNSDEGCAGGIVGFASTSVITNNSVNAGDIKAKNSGGAIGKAKSVSTVSGNKIVFKGIISGFYAGGIIGYGDSSNFGSTIIENQIKAQTTDQNSGYAGGFIGYGNSMGNDFPNGNIDVEIKGGTAGAVAGYLSGSNNITGITLRGSVTGKVDVGGFIGRAIGGITINVGGTGINDKFSITSSCKNLGGIVGYGENISISNVTPYSFGDGKFGSATQSLGSIMGHMKGGSITGSFGGSSYTFMTSGGGGSIGAVVGIMNGGSISMGSDGSMFSIANSFGESGGSGSYVGGFVGNLTSGTLSIPSKPIYAYISGGTTATGGICGNMGGTYANAFKLYGIVNGKSAGLLTGMGSDNVPNGSYIVQHIYGTNSNKPYRYAQLSADGGDPKELMTGGSGSTAWWGAPKFVGSMTHNFSSSLTNIRCLSSDCKNYSSGFSLGNAYSDTKGKPTYLAYQTTNGGELLIQVIIEEHIGKDFYYKEDSIKANATKDDGTNFNLTDTIKEHFDSGWKGNDSDAAALYIAKYAIGDRNLHDMKYGTKDSTDTFYDTSWEGVTIDDIIADYNTTYFQFTGTILSEENIKTKSDLINAINNIPNGSMGYKQANLDTGDVDGTFKLLQKWSAYRKSSYYDFIYKTNNGSTLDYRTAFTSNAALDKYIHSCYSGVQLKGGGLGNDEHNAYLDQLSKTVEDVYINKSTTGDGMEANGITLWYNGGSIYSQFKNLNNYDVSVNRNSASPESNCIDTITLTFKGHYDKPWSLGNFDFYVNFSFELWCTTSYDVKIYKVPNVEYGNIVGGLSSK